ncbi:MAG TPA: histidine phosphatase family protein [Tepidisphaeraceae bacterium]|nr:histidine phosphatase family protein [Tepidisphaeraceae bacterium]
MFRHFIARAAAVVGMVVVGGCAGPDWSERPAPRTSITRVLLVRHGESFANLPHAAEASSDRLDHLTPRGWDQAAAAADLLKHEPIPVIVYSPAARTRETAGAIAAKWNGAVTPVADDAFRPLAGGPDAMAMSQPANSDFGATVDQAANEIAELARRHPGRTVVVVTHGDVIAALTARAGGRAIAGAPASISQINVNGSQWRVPG